MLTIASMVTTCEHGRVDSLIVGELAASRMCMAIKWRKDIVRDILSSGLQRRKSDSILDKIHPDPIYNNTASAHRLNDMVITAKPQLALVPVCISVT